ncbi:S1 family peptidase [Mycolicibacterium pallens]|uniref:Serine protease n=1 Tax=Mycolicibacterium pallens TaxID=370524 RepID=A0ABX8VC35_9MYCO|nr:serine protease [Mycolicibacterium pallens]QYL15347.1 serine protease [Mycolicibacterium pallens]
MEIDKLDAVGILRVRDQDELTPRGSCFLFRSDIMALTAAHCLPDSIEPEAISVFFPRLGRTMTAQRVERHPKADIAALFFDGEDARTSSGFPTTAFWDGVVETRIGADFFAYGYPIDGPDDAATESPVARLVIGYLQRFMNYASPAGYEFLAGEMNVAAWSGLSGAPLFLSPTMVLGVVAGSIDSQFGTAVMLHGVAEWLNAVSPDRGRAWELSRRPGRPWNLGRR